MAGDHLHNAATIIMSNIMRDDNIAGNALLTQNLLNIKLLSVG